MLWSLIKILCFVALVGALALGAGFLMEADGFVRINAFGQEANLTVLQAVIGVALLAVLGYVLFKLLGLLIAVLKFVNGDETAVSRYFDRNRERKGYDALGEGMMALASGEGRLAMAKAEKAQKYLQKPELTKLLMAQAAEVTGDRGKAEKVYKELVQSDATRFVGVRGLLKQKLDAGDTDTALKLAEKAFAIKPKHEEVQDTLLQLQAGCSDWSGARKTLNAKLKHGTMPRDVHKRRDAVLALSEAKDILDDGKTDEARTAAIEAAKKSPDLIPAVAMAARGYIAQQRPKLAVRMIKKAWEVQPHPDLAAAFAEIEPNETPAERLKRFGVLTRIRPDHRETKLLLGELHLAAEDFPGARRAVGDLAEKDPDARVLTMMAAIERGEGAPEAVVRGWLATALTAPRGPQWVCDNCNNIHASWCPTCANCGAFDTLSWTTPPQAELSMPGGAEMLPLLIGAADGPADLPVTEEAVVVPSAPKDVTPAEEAVAETVDAVKTEATPEKDASRA